MYIMFFQPSTSSFYRNVIINFNKNLFAYSYLIDIEGGITGVVQIGDYLMI